ncbi:hypothetical protein GCM10010129_77720 [Streptomyces fumigatiscleroticus]|nr:hypothetical protein GCM10010129_77720 [Streptomyces fumigatiscleroticus]
MTATTTPAAALPAGHRERLMRFAREVSFQAGTRLFEEGRHAGRCWIVRTGTVTLDPHVPGRRAAVVEPLGHGELVGRSWHCPPYVWHPGAEAPGSGRAIAVRAGRVVADRPHASRIRLPDLYGPCGSGGPR